MNKTNKELQEAVKILKDGGIVVFPTDTAFGIGCRIDREDSIKKLFDIRKRPVSQATPVLISDLEMGRKYAEIPEVVIEKLAKKYWPGALTIVLNSKVDKVPDLVRGGGKNVGLRIPNHKITLDIINQVGVPILGPSANFHGENTPYRFEELDKNLMGMVDYVINGDCTLKEQSTVVDCSKDEWTIIRQGAIELKF